MRLSFHSALRPGTAGVLTEADIGPMGRVFHPRTPSAPFCLGGSCLSTAKVLLGMVRAVGWGRVESSLTPHVIGEQFQSASRAHRSPLVARRSLSLPLFYLYLGKGCRSNSQGRLLCPQGRAATRERDLPWLNPRGAPPSLCMAYGCSRARRGHLSHEPRDSGCGPPGWAVA